MWRQRQPGTRRAEVALRLLKTQPVHLWTYAGFWPLVTVRMQDVSSRHPKKWQKIKPKSDISLSVKYQQSHLPPPIRPVSHHGSRIFQKAWTSLTDASRKENVIKREPASLKSKCGKRLSLKQFILYFLGQTDTDFCISVMLRRTAQNEGSDTVKAYLELWIQTLQTMATLSNVPLIHVFLL